MHLIEILLPLADAVDSPFPEEMFENLAQELTEAFGGVTAFTRSPAQGRWKEGGGTEHDDIVVLEVMTEELDRDWWKSLRLRLMRDFDQDDVVIRCQSIERL